jgi:hypothetical protein
MWDSVRLATNTIRTRWQGWVSAPRHKVSLRKMLLVGEALQQGLLRSDRDAALVIADDVRDILGHLFFAGRIDPAWLSANDGAARRLAVEIEATGDYQHVPILGDALEDAGCDCEAILSHCRQPTRHVRGCWVVDLLTGSE